MISSQPTSYGLMLPHFGRHIDSTSLVDRVADMEEAGFSSVWVRDHLSYEPHGFEDQDPTFLEPFVVLAAVAARTSKVVLGTSSLIPFRHPIHTARLVSSLDFLSGGGRVVVGVGLGTFDDEFSLVGMEGWDRRDVLPEQVAIMRNLWDGGPVNFRGKYYEFEGVRVAPSPSPQPPIWYCGTSKAAVRRAVEYCDGWMPGRMPRHVFAARMERMALLAAEAKRAIPDTSMLVSLSPEGSRSDADRSINLPALFDEMNRKGYPGLTGGDVAELADLNGAVVLGSAEEIVENVEQWHALGCPNIVFDLRDHFDMWEEHVAFLAERVLPNLGAGGSREAAPPSSEMQS